MPFKTKLQILLKLLRYLQVILQTNYFSLSLLDLNY